MDALPPEKLQMTVSFSAIRWSKYVSNSHSAPRGEKTNFGGRATYTDGTLARTSFPGWTARVDIRSPKDSGFSLTKWRVSEALKTIGVNLGSGGGGSSHLSYDCKLFLADWPGFHDTIVYNKLSGKNLYGFE